MTHKKILPLLHCFALLLVLGIGAVVSGCNKKDDEPDSEYNASESVAITAFTLSADRKVMPKLDSVFFSIDLDHGVVYNADSLPKGTNVGKLVPKITYPNTVASAVIEMKGGQVREGTVDYFNNANDSIDFTGEVKLTLATANNTVSKTYTLKVNVHKEVPDTMYWDKVGAVDLPSRMASPKAQKTVNFKGGALTIIEENDGSLTTATATDVFSANWTKVALNLPFSPQLESLTSSKDNTLYLADDAGNLYSSADGLVWEKLTSGWNAIIGMYGDTLLGIQGTGGARTMTCWPEGVFADMALPEGFPQSGFSAPIEFTNRWTPYPTIVLFGGYPYAANGKSPAWAFDGSQWVDISEIALPAMSGLSVVNYYSFLKSSSGQTKEFEVYLAFGGKLASGSINRTVYVSYDFGINWQKAPEYLQLPSGVDCGYGADALSIAMTRESNLSDRWNLSGPKKLPYQVEGDIISWECPYIFLFGGYDSRGNLYPNIRSGLLQRLSFVPLF